MTRKFRRDASWYELESVVINSQTPAMKPVIKATVNQVAKNQRRRRHRLQMGRTMS